MGGTIQSAAVLSTVRPYPADNGKSVVITGFMEHLVERLGARNVHYLHVGRPLPETTLQNGVHVHEMGSPSRADQAHSILVNAGIRRRSLQESLTYSGAVEDRVRGTLTRLAPDLELIDTVRMEQYVRGFRPSGRRVLYLDDLFSVRYQRMLRVLEQDDTDFDPLGQFVSFVPERLQFLAQRPATRRLLLQTEVARIGAAEVEAARSAQVSVLLNHVEAVSLHRSSGARVEVVPPRLARPAHAVSGWSGRADFAFVGLLSIPHNHDALTWFLSACLPRIISMRPDARLHVVGRDPSPDLARRLDEFGAHVVRHGFVPDLDPLLGRMAALVNTLRFGSGIKIKALEALSRGLPVVATSVGAEGIIEESQPGMVVADDADGIARALVEMSDPDRRAFESAAASRLYEKLFSPEGVAEAYDRVFATRAAEDSTMRNSVLTNA